MNKNVTKFIVLFFTGMCLYTTIEVWFRGYSFRLMGLVGGFCFSYVLDKTNEWLPWDTPLILQMIVGCILITLIELISGEFSLHILNIRMWDYRNMCGNMFDGLVCPLFSFIWFLLSGIGIVLCDSINYYVLHENDQPYYRSLSGTILFKLPERHCK